MEENIQNVSRGFKLYLDMIDKILDILTKIFAKYATATSILNSKILRKIMPYIVVGSTCIAGGIVWFIAFKAEQNALKKIK